MCAKRGVNLCALCLLSPKGGGSGDLGDMRVLLRPLETAMTTQDFSVIHCMFVSRSPFPSESAFVFEALPQNCSWELQITVYYTRHTNPHSICMPLLLQSLDSSLLLYAQSTFKLQ